MKRDKFEKLIATFKSQSLSRAEKDEMLKGIRYAIAEERLRKDQKATSFFRFSLHLFLNKRMVATLSLLVLIFSTAGISRAAEQSLPGDFLYPVKTQVNERLQTSFALTSEQKARVASELTLKRLKEAEVLSKRGHLDEVRKAEITQNLTKYNDEVKKRITEVSENESKIKAADLDEKLDVSLGKHTEVLDELSKEIEIPEQTEVSEDSEIKNEKHLKLKRGKEDMDSKQVIRELKQRAQRASHRERDNEETGQTD